MATGDWSRSLSRHWRLSHRAISELWLAETEYDSSWSMSCTAADSRCCARVQWRLASPASRSNNTWESETGVDSSECTVLPAPRAGWRAARLGKGHGPQ